MADRMLGVLLALTCCIGCSVDGPSAAPGDPAPESVSIQLIRAHPQLQSIRFNDLLNFETPSDIVFLRSQGVSARIDPTRAHTGETSALLDGGNGTLSVKVSSVLGSRPFPGEWTLAGAWFLSDRPARVRVSCTSGGNVSAEQSIVLPPGQWTAALVELSLLGKSSGNFGADSMLSFDITAPGPVWCDDVILIDNTRWIVGNSQEANTWTIRRSGFSYICDAPGRFNLRLPSSEFHPAGWTLEEANLMRARMRSTGPQQALTVYSDGRSHWDGQFRPLSSETKSNPLWAQQQISPAQIQIPETMGRLNRNAPGDANNDGYDESRGSYSIAAMGPRLEVHILPRSVPVLNPVLEIRGLPPGEPLVTVEGRLIDGSIRLSDGTLLVELPLQFDRPLAVNIRIQ